MLPSLGNISSVTSLDIVSYVKMLDAMRSSYSNIQQFKIKYMKSVKYLFKNCFIFKKRLVS